MTISQRARDGRWRIRWVEPTGQRRERTAATETDAEALAATECARLLTPGAALQPDVTIDALVTAYLNPDAHADWRSGNTRDRLVGFARNHLLGGDGYGLTGRPCSSLDAASWNKVLKAMAAAGYSASTIKGVFDLMTAVVSWGQKRGVWDRWATPLDGVGLPTDIAPTDGTSTLIDPADVPSTAEVASLAAAADLLDKRHGLFIRLAAGSGMRWGELIALLPEDVDVESRHIRVVRQWREINGRPELALPKHGRRRHTILPKTLVDPITELLDRTDAGVELFRSSRGTIPRRSNFNRRVFQPARAGAVNPGYQPHHTLHSLRHHFCSDLIARGVKVATVSKLAGHATVRFTLDRYVGASSDYLDEATGII